MKLSHLSVLFCFVMSIYSEDSPLPFEIQQVKDYMLNREYPELFDTTHYRIQIPNVLTADIDGDNSIEAIVQTNPHYRQSATILIYRAVNGNIFRVTEGFAPGNLHKVTDKYLDSHSLGLAVDILSIDKNTGNAISIDSVYHGVLKTGMGGLVAYQSFFHMDMRKGATFFIDMSHISKIPQNQNTCEEFEFAELYQIAVGNYGDIPRCLFALTQDGVTIYHIKSFKPDGRISKDTYTFCPKYKIDKLQSGGGIVLAVDSKGNNHPIK